MAGFLFPFAYVPDPNKGKPVALGELYFGEADKDPESFPIQVYAKQEDGTLIAISLGGAIELSAGGVPTYNGSPVQLVVFETPFSLRVRSKNGAQVYYAEFVEGVPIASSSQILSFNNLADAIAYPVISENLGDFLVTAEYTDGSSVGGAKYKIVSSNPGYLGTINHQKTDGSGYYLQLIIDDELWIEDAGAYDGKLDSTANIQACINYLSNNNGVLLRAGKGTFNFSRLYTYYDAADNPDYNSDPDEEGQIQFVGSGRCSRVLYPSNLRGTTLNCTSTTGNGFNIGVNGEFSRGTTIRDMNIIGDIAGRLINQVSAPLFSHLDNLLIINADETATSVALYIVRCWLSKWTNVEVYGVTDTNAGIGLWYDVEDGAVFGGSGGLNLFENINCDRFANPAIFGREYDGSQTAESDFSKNNRIVNMQCKRGTEGLLIRHGIRDIQVVNMWGESNDTCHIRLRDRAANIYIEGGYWDFASEGVICEGINGGSTDQNTVTGVVVQSPDFAFVDNAGYRRYGTDESGLTELRNVRASNNGGTVVIADDRYQRINVEISDWDGVYSRVIRNESNTNAPELINHGNINHQEVQVSVDTTYATWRSVPGFIRGITTGGDVTITLPTPSLGTDFNDSVCIGDTITIFKDFGANNLNIAGGYTATLTAADSYVTLKATNTTWVDIS